MGRKRASTKIKLTAAQRAERADAAVAKKLLEISVRVDLPEAQRRPDLLVAEPTLIDDKPRPAKETVRKLTRVEQLERSGVLEPHEADACAWYADVYALGFDTIGCTANYGGGNGGGGFGAHDLLARYKAQGTARDDYWFARKAIPSALLAVFEGVVLGNRPISQIAAELFDHKRSQAENKARAALKTAANLLHMAVAPLLPEVRAKPAAVLAPVKKPPIPANTVTAAIATPVPLLSEELGAQLDRALSNDIAIVAIAIAPLTAKRLALETEQDGSFRGLPLTVRQEWSWGYLLIDGETVLASEQAA